MILSFFYSISYNIIMKYRTEQNYNVTLNPISNITIFVEIAKANLIVPKPPIYEDENGRLMENPFHPAYHDALSVYDLQRHLIAFDAIVKLCITLNDKFDEHEYLDAFNIVKKINLVSSTETLTSWFLKNYVLTQNDIQHIVLNTLLTENQVASIFNSIRITRDGQDIHRTPIKNSITTNIDTDAIVIAGYQIVSPIDEIKAAHFSSINWQSWQRCEVSLEEKATAVALYRLDRVVEAHSNDVVQIHQERESRKRAK